MLAAGGYGLLEVTDIDAATLRAFGCGKTHLDNFLQTVATAFHEQRLGLTTVVFHQDFDGIVGYFTLANDAIRLRDSERFDLGVDAAVELAFFPAVKLGRFAIAARLQGQRVGSAVMELVRGELLDSTSRSAGRLIVTDADNEERVVRFYEKAGFNRALFAEAQQQRETRGQRPHTVKMWLDVLA